MVGSAFPSTSLWSFCAGRMVGGITAQVKESLERLSGTIIQSKNAFYRKSTKSYLDDTFHLLDRVQHSESMDSLGRKSEKTWVKLSDYGR